MFKKSLALGLLALAGAAQAAVIPVAQKFNAQGYDYFSIVVTEDGIVDFQDTTAPPFDSLISLFDDVGKHIFTGDDTTASSQFHLTQDLEAGIYAVLVTVSDAGKNYFASVGTVSRSDDGFNFGGLFYRAGNGTLTGMRSALSAVTDPVLVEAPYALDISGPVSLPEPATYGLVALALTGLALSRRRMA